MRKNERPLLAIPPEFPANHGVGMIADMREISRVEMVQLRSQGPSEPILLGKEFLRRRGDDIRVIPLTWHLTPGEYELAVEIFLDGGIREVREFRFEVERHRTLLGRLIRRTGNAWAYFQAHLRGIVIAPRKRMEPSNSLVVHIPPGDSLQDMVLLKEYVVSLSTEGFIHLWDLRTLQRRSWKIAERGGKSGKIWTFSADQVAFQLGDDDIYVFQIDETGRPDFQGFLAFRNPLPDIAVPTTDGGRIFLSPSGKNQYYHQSSSGERVFHPLPLNTTTNQIEIQTIPGDSEGELPDEIAIRVSGEEYHIFEIDSMDEPLVEKGKTWLDDMSSTCGFRALSDDEFVTLDLRGDRLLVHSWQRGIIKEIKVSHLHAEDYLSTAVDCERRIYYAGDSACHVLMVDLETGTNEKWAAHEISGYKNATSGKVGKCGNITSMAANSGFLYTGGIDCKLKGFRVEEGGSIKQIFQTELEGNPQQIRIVGDMLYVSTGYCFYTIEARNGKIAKTVSLANSHGSYLDSFLELESSTDSQEERIMDPFVLSPVNGLICSGDWVGNLYETDLSLSPLSRRVFNITDKGIFDLAWLDEEAGTLLVVCEKSTIYAVDIHAEKVLGSLDIPCPVFSRRRSYDLIALGRYLVLSGSYTTSQHYNFIDLVPLEDIRVENGRIHLSDRMKVLSTAESLV